MDDNALFSHPVVTEPLAASDVNNRPVQTSIFSDCANTPVPVAPAAPE
jgi:hypothetical protein